MLGFVRFVGRGLRYVAVLGTLRIGLAGWQAGALKRRPRDRFIGWKAPQQVLAVARCCEQYAPAGASGAGRLPEPGQLLCRRDAPPPECRLQGGLRPSAGTGGDPCGSGEAPRNGVPSLQLGAGGAHQGLCTRPGRLHGSAWQAEGDGCLPAGPLVRWPGFARRSRIRTGRWPARRWRRRKRRFLRCWRRCSGSPTSAMPRGGGTSWRRCWPSACWRALRARSAATRPRATRDTMPQEHLAALDARREIGSGRPLHPAFASHDPPGDGAGGQRQSAGRGQPLGAGPPSPEPLCAGRGRQADQRREPQRHSAP